MARIPDADIERLKETVSLVGLAEAAGVQLVRHGADWHGRCPFHDDKTPSLVISPTKRLWHCLGACNAGGSAIDWVMRERGVPFRRAVELLRAQAGQLPIEAQRRGSLEPSVRLSRARRPRPSAVWCPRSAASSLCAVART